MAWTEKYVDAAAGGGGDGSTVSIVSRIETRGVFASTALTQGRFAADVTRGVFAGDRTQGRI